MWTQLQKIAIWLAAMGIAGFGARWLYLFMVTEYRPHHRGIMIPLALLALVFAVIVARLNIWAVLLLLVGVSTVGAIAIWLQISAGQLHPFLAACAVVAVAYLALLGLSVIRALTTHSSGPASPAA